MHAAEQQGGISKAISGVTTALIFDKVRISKPRLMDERLKELARFMAFRDR